MIPNEAVEAAADWLPHDRDCDSRPERDCQCRHLRVATMRAALEAALPILLSHEREETRLAHLDAVVNAASVSKYERAVDAVSALAEYWERTPALRKGPAAADIRAALTEALAE